MGQEKSNHVHALTLCFRDSTKEQQVSQEWGLLSFFFLKKSDTVCVVIAVPAGQRRELRQLAGVQPRAVGVPGRRAAGRAAADAHPAPAVPHRVRVDRRAAHDAAGRAAPLAPLGRDALVRVPLGHHRVHHRVAVRRGPSERGEFLCTLSASFSLFLSFPIKLSSFSFFFN